MWGQRDVRLINGLNQNEVVGKRETETNYQALWVNFHFYSHALWDVTEITEVETVTGGENEVTPQGLLSFPSVNGWKT